VVYMICTKCGALLDGVSEEQKFGRYITLCPRDASIENVNPYDEEED